MADAIFFNGDVITVEGDPSQWQVRAVAVQKGKIVYTGTKQGAMNYKTDDTTLIDLEGDTLMPGFIEPHTHPVTSAKIYKLDADVSGLLSDMDSREAWKSITDAIAACEAGGWVLVWGFNPMLVPGMVLPDLKGMDELAPTVNLCIILQGAHVMMVNSLTLKTAGVDETTEVVGGEFLKDENGRLNGMCYEVGAINRIIAHQPEIPEDVANEYVIDSLNMYGREGFTTVCAMGIGAVIPDPVNTIRNLARQANCPVRVVAYLDEPLMNAEGDDAKPCKPGTDNFCLTGAKYWADGSPYSGSIAVREPFVDSETTRGLGFLPYPNYGYLSYEHGDLHTRLLQFHRRDFQLCVHTHGERAIDQVLDIYETILRDEPKTDHRYRLEHCALITKPQLERAKKLGVYVSFYPDHIWFYGPFLRDDILGEDRTKRIMPFKTALDLGHEMTAHSDTPCTTLGIMRVIKTIATRAMRRPTEEVRRIRQPKQEEQLNPAECIPVDEAIKCVTINSAKQCFHDKIIGSIAIGKVADFTRLSGNPRKANPFDIDKIQIVNTYRDGKDAAFFPSMHLPRGVSKRFIPGKQQKKNQPQQSQRKR